MSRHRILGVFGLFACLFLDSAAFGQQSQGWKFPLSIPTTQSGFPSPVVAGPLALGAYSITAKTSLQIQIAFGFASAKLPVFRLLTQEMECFGTPLPILPRRRNS